MSITISQTADGSMIHVTGDVGAFIELDPRPAPGEPYYVALSDGTLLSGVFDDHISVEVPGRGKVTIVDGKVSVEGPIEWAVASIYAITQEETKQYRRDQAKLVSFIDDQGSPGAEQG